METRVQPVHADVRSFLEQELGRNLDGVTDRASLLEAGVLDSLGVIQLVSFIEQRFHMVVSEDDMMPDNFDSIEAIVAFVDRGGSGRAG